MSGVLKGLDYVKGAALRPKANGLRQMVAPAGIVVSELYHDGVFDGVHPEVLAEVLSWFASDVDRKRWNGFPLPAEINHLAECGH